MLDHWRWLREHPRDTALCVAGNIFGMFLVQKKTGELAVAGVVAGSISVIVLLCWPVIVTEGRVRDAADACSRALLAVCERAGTSE